MGGGGRRGGGRGGVGVRIGGRAGSGMIDGEREDMRGGGESHGRGRGVCWLGW